MSTLVRNGLGWCRTVRGNFCIDKGQLELRVVNGADLNLDVSFVFVGDCDISLQNLLLGPFTSRSDWALSICEVPWYVLFRWWDELQSVFDAIQNRDCSPKVFTLVRLWLGFVRLSSSL